MKNRKQRTFNQWVFIGILAVLAVMVTACTPQKEQTESSTQQQTATESGRIAEQTQTTAPSTHTQKSSTEIYPHLREHGRKPLHNHYRRNQPI